MATTITSHFALIDPELIRERIKLEWVPDKPLLGV